MDKSPDHLVGTVALLLRVRLEKLGFVLAEPPKAPSKTLREIHLSDGTRIRIMCCLLPISRVSLMEACRGVKPSDYLYVEGFRPGVVHGALGGATAGRGYLIPVRIVRGDKPLELKAWRANEGKEDGLQRLILEFGVKPPEARKTRTKR